VFFDWVGGGARLAAAPFPYPAAVKPPCIA
jgi:hypothetical protein